MRGDCTKGSWQHGLAWLGFRGGWGLRGPGTGDRMHVEMHGGDPVGLWGELGSKAWLGFRGDGGLVGRGLAPSPPCGLPDVCKCVSMQCVRLYIWLLFVYFNTCCHMHLEGA